jgi:hypothetical protein
MLDAALKRVTPAMATLRVHANICVEHALATKALK